MTEEYLSLQLAYDAQRLTALFVPERLTTARFESVYREMTGFGMLDLVFEDGEEIFVARAVGVDVVTLATREGPSLVWPATLRVRPQAADAVEDLVTPWLLALSRGRGMAGEYVRPYRPSAAFNEARSRRLYGAAITGDTLPRMAPFVYARRFARNRDVYVDCVDGALAAAVVGTVARSVTLRGTRDHFADRWYGLAAGNAERATAEVAIVDDMDDAYPRSAAFVVATSSHSAAARIAVPIPVANDHLFTFDPADAPETASFAVHAVDSVDRPRRFAVIPAAFGGSSGRVALVVRDDAWAAEDADTDAVTELAQRLCAEGLDAFTITAGDARLRTANIVHIFGGVEDSHVRTATDIARCERLPFVLNLQPRGPYSTYYEGALLATLRLGVDSFDRQQFLSMFYGRLLRFDNLPHERSADATEAIDRAFERSCIGAMGVILDPSDDTAAFCARFPRIDAGCVIRGATFLAAEAEEAAIAELVQAEPFLLVHAPIARRSAIGHILTSLAKTDFGVVVAGPMSEVDIGFTLRRIAGSNVIVLPDPTPGQVAALYRRARAIAFPALRPTGASRFLRAVFCGAVPLVPAGSPFARLTRAAVTFDPWSRGDTLGVIQTVMTTMGPSSVMPDLARELAAHADQAAALGTIVSTYARAATPAELEER